MKLALTQVMAQVMGCDQLNQWWLSFLLLCNMESIAGKEWIIVFVVFEEPA